LQQILNIFPIYVEVFSNKARFAPRSSLQTLYGRYHELVDSYEVSNSQIAMDRQLRSKYLLCKKGTM
jgi:hypothetical protein